MKDLSWAVTAPLVLLVASCGSERPEGARAPKSPQPKAPPPAVAGEFGAAAWIPANASYFSSIHELGQLWEDLESTAAIRRIRGLPLVQLGLAALQDSPVMRGLMNARRRDDLLDEGLELAVEVATRESFIYAGAECAEFSRAAVDLWLEGVIAELRDEFDRGAGRRPDRGTQWVTEMLRHSDVLRMPPVVAGFRIESPRVVAAWLDRAIARLPENIPFNVTREVLGGGRYHTVTLTPDDVPMWRRVLHANLRGSGVQRELASRVEEFVSSQRLAIAVGVRDDYLLISLGSDNRHLESFGANDALADTEALTRVRRLGRPNLLSLTYVSAAMRMNGNVMLDAAEAALDRVLGAAPLAEGEVSVRDRARRDAKQLLTELRADLPSPTPSVSASFRNRGIESFDFGLHVQAGGDDEPLSLLGHAGPRPLFASAARSPSIVKTFERSCHWTKVGYGYFRELCVPEMNSSVRREFERFELVFIPALRELETITRDLLIPSIDACESMFTVAVQDGAPLASSAELAMRSLMAIGLRLRPAFAAELNDSEQFVTACARYCDVINGVLARASEFEQVDGAADIPAPNLRTVGDATIYTYPMPNERDLDVEPNALIRDGLLVMSLDTEQSTTMCELGVAPTSEVVDLTAPSNGAVFVDLEQIVALAGEASKLIVQAMDGAGELARRDARLARFHIGELQKSLGALRSYYSRTYRENGGLVRHAWLQVEDDD